MSTPRSTLLLGFLIVVGSAGVTQNASAQRGTNPRAAARKAERQEAKAEAKAAAKGETPAEREARQQRLAGQVREAFARVVRQRLNLTDDQARRLKDVDDRYETQRNDVARDERQARQALRTSLAAPNADQSKIDENMAVITNAQKRRADILASEQRDLGGFLTPRQRAQYFAMRDNLARRIQAMRQKAAAGAPPEPEQP